MSTKTSKTSLNNRSPLLINCNPDESQTDGTARVLLEPATNAALAMEVIYNKGGTLSVDVNSVRNAIATSAAKAADGDLSGVKKMLASQLHTLDALFSRMVRRTERATTLEEHKANSVLAMRAAQQTASTARVLNELVNPFVATFIGKQQVDARQQTLIQQRQPAPVLEYQDQHNELLPEIPHHETLDTRGTAEAAGGHSAMEAVGEIHRPQNRSRKGQKHGQPQG